MRKLGFGQDLADARASTLSTQPLSFYYQLHLLHLPPTASASKGSECSPSWDGDPGAFWGGPWSSLSTPWITLDLVLERFVHSHQHLLSSGWWEQTLGECKARWKHRKSFESAKRMGYPEIDKKLKTPWSFLKKNIMPLLTIITVLLGNSLFLLSPYFLHVLLIFCCVFYETATPQMFSYWLDPDLGHRARLETTE